MSTGTDLGETTVIKDENVFVVAHRDGSLPVDEPHPLGLYLDDCRYLSGHELTVCGARPRLLVMSAAPGSEALHELTNPALRVPGRGVLPPQSLRLRLERRIGPGAALEETLLVRSYDRERLRLDLELTLAADFRPMLVVRGVVTDWTPPEPLVERLPDGLRISAVGRDGRLRATTIRADRPAEPGARPGSLRFALDLPPGGAETINLRYDLQGGDAEPPGAGVPPPRTGARSTPEAWLAGRTEVVTDDQLFDRVLRRSLLDVRLLHGELDGTGYAMAGIPWFATLFGRDSLICATQLLAFDPPMAAGTLRVLARRLGRRDDPEHDEEPGKVLHEWRVGELAHLGVTPLTRYYGTVDATPLFLCLLCDYVDWSGDASLFRDLRPEVEAMLGWMTGPGDRDGDGLLDYAQRAPKGLRNQGWKDSAAGVLDERGAALEPPITLVEPQAYAMRARRRLARLYELEGDTATARRLHAEAARQRELVERFWLPDAGYYSMGFGADRRPSGALASNQGHLLWGLAVSRERAAAIRSAVMSPAMFSGWGIRTLAEGEAGYNPVGYHLGTVWPHDTAMIAVGLREYGFDADFDQVFQALLEAASTADAYRLPELFAGFRRTEFETPVPYRVACRPQAWAAGAIPHLLACGLGLVPDGLERRLRIRRPSLPAWLDRVEVRGLRIAGARVDLRLERVGGGVHVALTDARVDGDVEVVLEVAGSRLPDVG